MTRTFYRVRLKPYHPSGAYRRSGLLFTSEPATLDKITEAIRNDPWLIVEEIKEKKSGDDKSA